MASTLLITPGRGRSRFSKMLPTPPGGKDPKSPVSISASKNSPLPPLPQNAIPPSKSIPRKAVGMTADQKSLAAALTKASNSPLHPSVSAALRKNSDSNSSGDGVISLYDSESIMTPPIPPKDEQRKLSRSPPKTANNPGTSFPAFQTSPPRPEIWRRRSIKSDRSIIFPEMKLDKSNGSTASPPRQGRPTSPKPRVPRSDTSQRKPIPARPAPPQPELMGNKVGKLNDKKLLAKFEPPIKENEVISPRYPLNQPPTPEYLKADGDLPTLPQVLSPISPATPPEDTTPLIPVRSDSRKPLTTRLTAPPEANHRLTTTEIEHSRTSSETLTITSLRPQASGRSPGLTQQRSPPLEKTSPLVLPSPATRPADILFPTVPSPAPEGSVLPGLPLSTIHYECYQSHKFMRGSKNVLCPVACMVCQNGDADMRWRCTWCCLSACGKCMQVLKSIPGKDLRLCLESIRA